jgi:hypothetical protein
MTFVKSAECWRKRRNVGNNSANSPNSHKEAFPDVTNYFQTLFKSTSPSHWYELMAVSDLDWKFRMGYTAVGLFIAAGDALLVGAMPDLHLSSNAHGNFVAGVSLLYHLYRI